MIQPPAVMSWPWALVTVSSQRVPAGTPVIWTCSSVPQGSAAYRTVAEAPVAALAPVAVPVHRGVVAAAVLAGRAWNAAAPAPAGAGPAARPALPAPRGTTGTPPDALLSGRAHQARSRRADKRQAGYGPVRSRHG